MDFLFGEDRLNLNPGRVEFPALVCGDFGSTARIVASCQLECRLKAENFFSATLKQQSKGLLIIAFDPLFAPSSRRERFQS